MAPIPYEQFDLAAHLRPGDRLMCGQGTAEPRTLTEMLVRQRARIGGCTLFIGPLYSDTFRPDACDGIAFEGYGAIGKAAQLARAGLLDPLPWHYSAISRGYATGALRADVVLVQLAPGRGGRGYSLSLSHDYLVHAARHARLVIAEVNPAAPWTHGADWPADIPIHIAVAALHPPVELPDPPLSVTERAIAAHVATLIPDRAVLQVGVGTVPHAILEQLHSHRDLGVHSGVLTDGMVDLIEKGVITNAHKPFDTGISVGNVAFGTRKLFRFIDDNPAIRLAPPEHTHGFDILSRIPALMALNSAIEVDLTGQINAEIAGGAYVGAVGGQLDFVRGANAAPGGRAIIALPATARGGSVSRIVARLANVTCPRADADAIVTEYGIAELRGCTLSERAKRLIAIAAPQFREDLARQFHECTR